MSGDKNHSPLWQLTLARWRSFYREPSTIFWAFVFPIVLAMALGIAFRNRPPEPVGRRRASRRRRARGVPRAARRRKRSRSRVLDAAAAHEALRTGKVSIVVVPGAARHLSLRSDAPRERLARAVVDDALQRADGRKDPTRGARRARHRAGLALHRLPRPRPARAQPDVVGHVGHRLRHRRDAHAQAHQAPARHADEEARFSHRVRAPCARLFLLVELPLLIGFAWLAFHVGVRGSLALLLACATLGALTFAGLGLLIASRAQNTQTVNGLINLVQMPMFVASGVFFSSARFPEVLQPFIRALPLTALNDALRGIMIDGAGTASDRRAGRDPGSLRPALVRGRLAHLPLAVKRSLCDSLQSSSRMLNLLCAPLHGGIHASFPGGSGGRRSGVWHQWLEFWLCWPDGQRHARGRCWRSARNRRWRSSRCGHGCRCGHRQRRCRHWSGRRRSGRRKRRRRFRRMQAPEALPAQASRRALPARRCNSS